MRLTRTGYYYLLLLITIFFAGMRREMNLLWLVSGMMLGPLALSVPFPWWILRKLSVRRVFPESCYPGEKVSYTLEMETCSKFRFCGMTLNANPDSETFQLEKIQEWTPEQHRFRRNLRYSAVFARRGEYALPSVTVRCDYPFGFVVARKTFSFSDSILVLPKRVEIPLESFLSGGDWTEDEPDAQNGQGAAMLGDFDGLRLWAAGDLLQQVHWRASARHQQLLVQKLEMPRESRFYILADFTDLDTKRLERSVSLTASLVHEIERGKLRNPGEKVFLYLKILGSKTVIVTNDDADFYYRAMRELAVVERRTTEIPGGVQAEWGALRAAQSRGIFLLVSAVGIAEWSGESSEE